MTIARFEEICEIFCRHAKAPATAPQEDGEGLFAIHVEYRGVVTSVIYAPGTSREQAVVLFELGPLDGQPVEPSLIMRNLLTTNFLPWRGAHAPVFGLHPETGGVVLQCTYPIFDTQPDGLFRLVDEGVSLALKWREDFLMHD